MSVEDQIAETGQQEEESWEAAFDEAVAGGEKEPEPDEQEEDQGEPDQEESESGDEPDQESEGDEEKPEPKLTLEQRLEKAEADRDKYLKERDQYLHQFQSNSGRITAYQRQIQTLESQVEGKGRQKGESQEDAQERVAKEMNDSSWDELQEEFPEVAKALEKRLEQRVGQVVEERLNGFTKELQPIRDRLQQQDKQAELSALEADFPDWQETVNTAEYLEWIAQQPEPVRQLEQSPRAADAAYLLRSFKRDAAPEPASPNAGIQEQRRKQLQNSVLPSSKRSVKKEIADDDFDSAWDAAVRASSRGR